MGLNHCVYLIPYPSHSFFPIHFGATLVSVVMPLNPRKKVIERLYSLHDVSESEMVASSISLSIHSLLPFRFFSISIMNVQVTRIQNSRIIIAGFPE